MDLGLEGRRAVVLGGTRGIGRAIVETLAAEGCRIAFCARQRAAVADFAGRLAADGADATGSAVDIADPAALTAWIGEAAAALGGIDILISNASAMAHGPGPGPWEQCFRTDVMGAVTGFEAAAPHLERAAAANGDAAFATIASVSGHAADTPSAYGAMKAALMHYTKGVARGWAGRKVRANVVSPGTVFFEGGVWDDRKREEPELFARALKHNPTGRMGTPQEIADAAVFLCSPRSGFTTGSILTVDGALLSGLQI